MATSNTSSRHGKHHEDKVNFGGMVTPQFKALAQLTASKCECTLMDLMMNGIRYYATEKGIMVDGEIAPEYKNVVECMAKVIRHKLEQKRKGI